MLANIKELRDNMKLNGWIIHAFLFTYKKVNYDVLITRYVDDEPKPPYAIAKIKFYKEDTGDVLACVAFATSLGITTPELCAFFGIENTHRHPRGIFIQFYEYLNPLVPTEVIPPMKSRLQNRIVRELASHGQEDEDKIYLKAVKRNHRDGDKQYKRTVYNDNKTRLLRPDVYEIFKNEKTISFVYSINPDEAKSIQEIRAQFARGEKLSY